MPRVTLVVPAFQAETTLGATLSSALRQTRPFDEVVVVDDGSTDRTSAVAAALAPDVRVVRQPNGGVAAARNRGIAEATGDLVALCDADDILFDQHLEALLGVWAGAPAPAVATANAYWLLPGGIEPGHTRLGGRFPRPGVQRRALLEANFVSTMALFPRQLVETVGPFDEHLSHAEDWDFWLRAVFAGTVVVPQRRPLALYRWHAAGLSADPDAMVRGVRQVLAKMAARDDLTPAERSYLDRRLAGPDPATSIRDGERALLDRRYGDAARALRTAAALVPHERPLVAKARLLSLAPALAGPVLRAHLHRRRAALSLDDGLVR